MHKAFQKLFIPKWICYVVSCLTSQDFPFQSGFKVHDKFSTINSLTLITHTSHFSHFMLYIYMQNVLERNPICIHAQVIFMLKRNFNAFPTTKEKIYRNFMQILIPMRTQVREKTRHCSTPAAAGKFHSSRRVKLL